MDRQRGARETQSTGNFVSLARLASIEMTLGHIIRSKGGRVGPRGLGRDRSRVRSRRAGFMGMRFADWGEEIVDA